ncbi:SUKH-4 family immunity protein [Kitasatospora sp. DSM 101779]|uniref:SUKH-4 family immunity protein n=1 Tax=Kitasatospora sp. DSM 101779 TaxID=2853165 RepID=UPI0021DB5126|nr:SUKH-4 family immunity protein [Kitasatospora sp. DSM 101779]MCU7826985.1 SUKH-4 family immunity protein [Kitasatospora sp. DSM 101779]
MGTSAWQPAGFPARLAEHQDVLTEVARVYGTEDGAGPEEWAARLRFAALMRGDRSLARWLDGLGLAMPWRVVWAHWRPIEMWDTRGIAPGWTGPVELHGFRAGGSEVCLQSRYDHTYRWYDLESGAPLGGPSPDEPAHVEPPAVEESPLDAGEPFYAMAEITVTRAGATSVHAIYPVAHDEEIHVLPGERVLLAGYSGAALIDFGPAAAAAAAAAAAGEVAGTGTGQDPDGGSHHRETAPNLLPRDAWWDIARLTPEDVQPYYRGLVLADPVQLAEATGGADTARALATLGLPRISALGWLDTDRAMAELAVTDGRLVIAHVHGEPALWVDLPTGRVLDSSGDTVNTSLTAFAACLAMSDWALSLSVGRTVRGDDEFREHYAFLAYVRASLARIDPAAAAAAEDDEWWWRGQTEDHCYSLEA